MNPHLFPDYTVTQLPSLTPPEDPFYAELFRRKPELKMNLGLDNIRKALAHYSNPHRHIPVILVAGTNGKGSTVRFLEYSLLRAGYRIGSYLSPHIVHPRERFRILGEELSEEDLLPLLKELYHRHPELSFFELLTLAAFLLFREREVELAIMEIGLGGRLDAVNVSERVLASVITSIGFDHRDILGMTLTAIAREKGGVIRSGVPFFTGELPQEALEVYVSMTEAACSPWFQIPPLSTPMEIPAHFAQNMALAQAVAERIFGLKPLSIKELYRQRPLGRFSILQQSPLKLVDGAHNPPGARALAQALERLGLSRLRVFVRMGRSKEAEPFLKELSPYAVHFHFVEEMEPEWYSGKELGELLPSGACTILPLPQFLQLFIYNPEPSLFTGSLRGLKELFLSWQVRGSILGSSRQHLGSNV